MKNLKLLLTLNSKDFDECMYNYNVSTKWTHLENREKSSPSTQNVKGSTSKSRPQRRWLVPKKKKFFGRLKFRNRRPRAKYHRLAGQGSFSFPTYRPNFFETIAIIIILNYNVLEKNFRPVSWISVYCVYFVIVSSVNNEKLLNEKPVVSPYRMAFQCRLYVYSTNKLFSPSSVS